MRVKPGDLVVPIRTITMGDIIAWVGKAYSVDAVDEHGSVMICSWGMALFPNEYEIYNPPLENE